MNPNLNKTQQVVSGVSFACMFDLKFHENSWFLEAMDEDSRLLERIIHDIFDNLKMYKYCLYYVTKVACKFGYIKINNLIHFKLPKMPCMKLSTNRNLIF